MLCSSESYTVSGSLMSELPLQDKEKVNLMVIPKFRMFSSLMLAISLLAFSAVAVVAQDTTNPAGSRSVASGQKMKVKGVVTRRDADTFTIRDNNGVDTVVRAFGAEVGERLDSGNA